MTKRIIFLFKGVFKKAVRLILWVDVIIRSFVQGVFSKKERPLDSVISREVFLERCDKNPLLSPSIENDWEYGGTFNPAVWRSENGDFHMIYRAVGADGVSRFGYAVGKDGVSFSRLPYPIFFMESPCLQQQLDTYVHSRRYDPMAYPSGGSWGGCEDPRMVLIDDHFYLTFSAFDGWDFIRVALTTISKEDFLAQKWKWSDPVFLSPEGEIHKNWVIFPEKINNKFAVIHSISPSIQVDYIDDINDIRCRAVNIKSNFGIKTPRTEWDTWPRGVGAPPLKTEEGWLIFYHATNKHESHKYKLGVMLLDLKNPEKIIARSTAPVLSPDVWYENDSKPGVVYVCGSIIVEDTIYVYYGGGDRHVCMAQIPLKKLLNWVRENNSNH